MLNSSIFFGVLVSLLSYEAGVLVKRKFKLAIFNPLLVSVALTIIVLLIFKVDYQTYNEGAKYISYLLTPATICLAIPLYEQFELLKKNSAAVMGGIFAGVMTSMITVFALAFLFKLEHADYVTLLPKSITTAIGMSVSESLGGNVSITVTTIVITGVLGNMLAETVCRLAHIEEPIAKGVGIGSAAHAMGTARAMEMGEIEGAMSSLAISVAGILTVVTSGIFADLI